MMEYFMSDMCEKCKVKFIQGHQIEIHEYYRDLDRERIIYVCKHLNPYKKLENRGEEINVRIV